MDDIGSLLASLECQPYLHSVGFDERPGRTLGPSISQIQPQMKSQRDLLSPLSVANKQLFPEFVFGKNSLWTTVH